MCIISRQGVSFQHIIFLFNNALIVSDGPKKTIETSFHFIPLDHIIIIALLSGTFHFPATLEK